jgi:thioredoxin-like negative regulator of GroEL
MRAPSKTFLVWSPLLLCFVWKAHAFEHGQFVRTLRTFSTARPVSFTVSDLELDDYREYESVESYRVHSKHAEQVVGVYRILSKTQYINFLTSVGKNKIVVLKIFAPWCRACKALAPKFSQITQDERYNDNLPIVWAELSVQFNKELVVDELAVDALPTVQFYVDGRLEDSFACGPTKLVLLKRRLAQMINANVDTQTRQLKQRSSS